jgi:formylglycine-generating enzyme required for sulfatase activity
MANTRDYTNGMDLGLGYNALTGEPSIQVVEYQGTRTPGDQTGQEVDFLFKRITSTEELMEVLGFEGSGNINASWFALKGSVKANAFSESSRKVNSYSTFSLLYVRVHQISKNIYGTDLSQAGLDFIEAKGLEEFHSRAGHEYIDGFINGGEFISAIEIISQDSETKAKVDKALEAQISISTLIPMGKGVDATMQLRSTFEELAKNKNVSIQVKCYRQGGTGAIPTTTEEALEYAKNFPATVEQSAVPLQVITKPYSNLLSYPSGMKLLFLRRQQSVLKSLWQQYAQTLDTLSNVNYILKYPDQFDKIQEQILKAGKKRLEQRLDEIADLAMEYAHAPEHIKVEDSEFDDIQIELPPRKAIPAASTQSTPALPGTEFSYKTITVNSYGTVIDSRTCTNRQQIFDLGGVRLEMVYVPAGSFMMGSELLDKEKPIHYVTLAAFWMGKYPITQAQYRAIMGDNPAHFKGDNRPVECVSWYKAVEFCRQLSARTGEAFTLPSEAQWEYACRAGTTTEFYFGETITTDIANYNGDYTYANAPKGQYRKETTNVGNFPPNAWGLYDMHGNVWEWCGDTWHDNYAGAPTDGSPWITGGDDNCSPLRGGSWFNNPNGCRSAYRGNVTRGNDDLNNGFRVVRPASRTV